MGGPKKKAGHRRLLFRGQIFAYQKVREQLPVTLLLRPILVVIASSGREKSVGEKETLDPINYQTKLTPLEMQDHTRLY